MKPGFDAITSLEIDDRSLVRWLFLEPWQAAIATLAVSILQSSIQSGRGVVLVNFILSADEVELILQQPDTVERPDQPPSQSPDQPSSSPAKTDPDQE